MKTNHFAKKGLACQAHTPPCASLFIRFNSVILIAITSFLLLSVLLIPLNSLCQYTIVFDDSSRFDRCYLIDNELLFSEDKQINSSSLQANYLYDRKWIPDNSSGIMPLEICYVSDQNKYYIYGDRKMLVMNDQYEFIMKNT